MFAIPNYQLIKKCTIQLSNVEKIVKYGIPDS